MDGGVQRQAFWAVGEGHPWGWEGSGRRERGGRLFGVMGFLPNGDLISEPEHTVREDATGGGTAPSLMPPGRLAL